MNKYKISRVMNDGINGGKVYTQIISADSVRVYRGKYTRWRDYLNDMYLYKHHIVMLQKGWWIFKRDVKVVKKELIGILPYVIEFIVLDEE